jgi:hypothetical protein
MPTNITDVSTFTAPIVTVADGDAANAADVAVAVQGLANRTRALQGVVNVGGPGHMDNGSRFKASAAGSDVLAGFCDHNAYTPALSNGGGGGTFTFTTQSGWFTRIGGLVVFRVAIKFQKNGGAGNFLCSLPYPVTFTGEIAGSGLQIAHCGIPGFSGGASVAGPLVARVVSGDPSHFFLQEDVGGGGAIAATDLTDAVDQQFSLTGQYFTTAAF